MKENSNDTPLLSIIVPTFNERENVPVLLRRLDETLADRLQYEVIIVDDNSPDGTWELVEGISRERANVRLLRRIDRRGLSSAVIDGFLAARGDALAVIDADGQHDETILPSMYEELSNSRVVVGSRKVSGGSVSSEWSPIRRFISWGATMIARLFLRVRLKDPMSGFFMIRRDVFDNIADILNPRGFKILLELIHRSRIEDVAEIGYAFRPRVHGESKLSTNVMFDYLWAIYDLAFGKYLPISFIKFSAVGLSGVVVNLGVLKLSLVYLTESERIALLPAIGLAMLNNYLLNNFWTFRAQALRGFGALALGLIKFILICSTGALINYSVALLITEKAGVNVYLADLSGIAVATAWNYLINTRYTWKQN